MQVCDLRDMHRFMHGQNDRGDIQTPLGFGDIQVTSFLGDIHGPKTVVNVDLLRKSSIQICNLEIFFLQIYLYSSFLDGRLP